MRPASVVAARKPVANVQNGRQELGGPRAGASSSTAMFPMQESALTLHEVSFGPVG